VVRVIGQRYPKHVWHEPSITGNGGGTAWHKIRFWILRELSSQISGLKGCDQPVFIAGYSEEQYSSIIWQIFVKSWKYYW
jgi:hypothetical protein